MIPEVWPAVSACTGVANTSWLAPAAPTVSVWVVVGLARALSEAVREGLPARVSLYLKPALLAPLPMVTLVMLVVSAAARKWPPLRDALPIFRLTAWVLVAVATLP